MTPTPINESRAEQGWIGRMVPLQYITIDPALQVRGSVDPARVAEYTEIIREHKYMDPLRLFTETGDAPFFCADGFHRYDSYVAAGYDPGTVVPAKIKIGSRSDALRFAIKENGHHGAQMTNAQKRHAAELAVVDKTLGELPDAVLAKMIGCSSSLVASARRGESLEETRKKRHQAEPPAAGQPDGGAEDAPKFTIHETVEGEEAESAPAATTGNAARSSAGVESPAPPSSRARERKDPKLSDRPSKAIMLKQIGSWIDSDMVDEADVIEMLSTQTGTYHFLPRAGGLIRLKVVGKNGRAQVEVPVLIVKQLAFEQFTLKLEDGKLKLDTEE